MSSAKTPTIPTNCYIVMWCSEGLESIVRCDSADAVWEILQTGSSERMKDLDRTIWAMKLRARYNLQRHYEIYAISCTKDIDEDVLRNGFETHPQGMADLLRERGVKIYSDRALDQPHVIR